MGIQELYHDWEGDKKVLKSHLKQTLKSITKCALSNPDNYDQLLSFVNGIISELDNNLTESEKHFTEAARLAQQYGFRQFEAFFQEKLAKVLFKQNKQSDGIVAMSESKDLYERWGAAWKVEQMTKEFLS